MRQCLRGCAGVIMALALMLSCAPVRCIAQDPVAYTESYFARQESPSRWVMVPTGEIIRYYAQNDTLWGDLTYESAASSRTRPMRDGACCPTSAAMALRRLLSPEELLPLLSQAPRRYSLCVCSVNPHGCNGNHARIYLTSAKDAERLLPAILADYAAGNNPEREVYRGVDAGTPAGFLQPLAQQLGLKLTSTQDLKQALDAIDRGAAVIGTAARGGAFTDTGHYVLIAGHDEEKIYILDPLCRTRYTSNHGSCVEILEPGLVAVAWGQYDLTGIYQYFILEKSH